MQYGVLGAGRAVATWKECVDRVKMQGGCRDDVKCRMGAGRGLRGQGGEFGCRVGAWGGAGRGLRVQGRVVCRKRFRVQRRWGAECREVSLGADLVHGEVQGGDLGCRAERLGACKGSGCRRDAEGGPHPLTSSFPGSKSRTYQVVLGEYDMSAGEGPEQRIPVNSDDIFVHPKWLSFCAACG